MKTKLKEMETMFKNIFLGIILFAFGSANAQNCNPKFSYTVDSSGYIIHFMDTSSGGITNWYWSFGDGFSSTNKDPHHQYLSPGKYPVCLSVVNANQSCYGTFCDTVNIPFSPSCKAYFNAFPDSSTGVNFQNLSAVKNAIFHWDFGDNNMSYQKDPYHQYAKSGSYYVCLSIKDTVTHCSDTYCQIIYAYSAITNCQAYFSYNSNSGSTIQFYDQSQGGISNWYWDFGDGNNSYHQSPIHTYAHSGYYYVCLSTYDSTQTCSSYFCDTVYVNTGTVCQAGYSSQPDSAGNGVHFTNSSQGGTYYFWSFGDGSYSNNFDPHHVYPQAGTYQVCLTISNAGNTCSDSVCNTIYVGNNSNACKAYFYYTAAGAGSMYFVNYSVGNSFISQWSFGDGSYSHNSNPTHTYNHSGYYMVCLSISDSLQNCTDTYCDTLYVGSPISCYAAFSSLPDSAGGVHFVNNSLGGKNYHWSFGDGTFSNSFDPYHSYTHAGYYQVCLVVSDQANTCVDSICNSIYAGPSSGSCQAYFYYTAGGGGNVYFSNYSSGNAFISQWSFGDGTYSSNSNPLHNYLHAGHYQVCLNIKDTLNNCTDTYCDTLYVGSQVSCQASFSSYADSLGNGVHFINNSLGGVHYFWSFGDGKTSTLFDPHHVYAQSGYYQVCLRIYDNIINCSDSICTTVFAGNNSNACKAYFYYTSTGNGGLYFVNYSSGSALVSQWSFGDGSYSFTSNPTHTYNQSGYYQVCLSIVDSLHNCSDVYCDSVYVMLQPSCKAAFSFHLDSLGTGVQFLDMSAGALSYQWNFGDGTFSNQQHPHHIYTSPGSYLACLSISNYINSCYDSICQLVVVTKNPLGCQAYFVDSILNSGAIAFMDYSIGSMNSYSWNFGDGTYSNQQNPIHYFFQAGTYQVCLSISDNLNTCNDIYCQSIYVGSLNCKAGFIHHPDSSGNGIHFSNTSIGGTSYLWSFGDGHHSVNFDPHHVYPNPGYYQVCLSITDSIHSCTDTYCDYVYVNGCNIGFTYHIDTVHPGGGVTFHDYSSNINTSWYWDFGDSSFSSQKTPNHIYALPGTYLVCMSVLGNNPLCNGFYCDTVVINSFSQGISDKENGKIKLEVYPNPSYHETNISFDLIKSGHVLLEIYTITGIKKKTLQNAELIKGNHRISFSADDMESGLYFLKLTMGDKILVRKLQIAR